MRQHASARRQRRGAVLFGLESVEPRQLLSVSLADGVLTYTGTPAADSVYITYIVAGDRIVVLEGGAQVASYARTAVKSIVATGGAGSDSISVHAGIAAPTLIDGGEGDDALGSGTGNDTVIGGDGDDILTGGDGNDRLEGGEGNNRLSGSNGNDTLIANGGADQLSGGAGNDLLDGGLGADKLNGDLGIDTVTYASRTNAVFVDISNDAGETPDDGEAGERDDVGVTVENVIGGAGDDMLAGTAVRAGDTTEGVSFNNRLVGGGGNDTLHGLDGNDVLDGGKGRDWFVGGAGVDTADYSSRNEKLTLSLDGLANDGAARERDRISTDIENASGGAAADTIIGSALANLLVGNGGNDVIRGGSGNDTLYGSGGRDSLYGEAGKDRLFARGSRGDKDMLDGGRGADSAQKDKADRLKAIETLLG